ncbi:uncharacterized protein LOC128888173 [Hylaeus anthracinus]|uniref:uncharacterized protein LOC128874474 n=1 Tax=Hylaeus volcanicus TaxID=313075 RepID=UPI0023B7B016|nr:uncharacterized protein LOC128874474 [Hylaeus volcanicus]XP_054000801.1 uncharacterized protein LOC128888173 [Hylaeus anthracinus]
MTTVVAFIQRCMIVVAIFLCYFYVQGENVDCELYPFHQTCRGTMSRKRATFPILYRSGCDGSKGGLNCLREYEDKARIAYVPLSKSKLLIALLDNDLPKDVTYTARHRQRNNVMDERRPLMENFLSELESSDINY